MFDDDSGKTPLIVPEKMEDVKSIASVEEFTFTLESDPEDDPIGVLYHPEMLQAAVSSDSPTMSMSYEDDVG